MPAETQVPEGMVDLGLGVVERKDLEENLAFRTAMDTFITVNEESLQQGHSLRYEISPRGEVVDTYLGDVLRFVPGQQMDGGAWVRTPLEFILIPAEESEFY